MTLIVAARFCGPEGCGSDTDRYTSKVTINPGTKTSRVNGQNLYFPDSGNFGNKPSVLTCQRPRLRRRHQEMERQYPPFGGIPSLVAGDRELRVNGRALGLISGIFALPTGFFVHLWTATSDPELSGATYAFQRLDSATAPTDLKVVARVDDSADAMPANLVSGGGGQDETGADARTFRLWFALDLTEVRDSVQVTVSWPPAGWEASLQLPADALSAAAARSGHLPGVGE